MSVILLFLLFFILTLVGVSIPLPQAQTLLFDLVQALPFIL